MHTRNTPHVSNRSPQKVDLVGITFSYINFDNFGEEDVRLLTGMPLCDVFHQ